MTNRQAIERIEDHIRVHALAEPRADLIHVALRMAIEALKQPEIVHCKDCVYHNWDIVDGPYGLAQEIHWCDKLYDGPGESLAVLPSYHFCAWAKRKGKENGND